MVAVNRRFQPMLNEARRMVERDGPIATIVSEFYHYSMALYRQLGSSEQTLANIITPGAIHSIDLVRYLGGDVAAVHASADAYFDPHSDSFTALIRFQGGANALLNYNLTSPVRIEKVSFHGRQASAFLVGLAESCVVHQGDLTFDLKNIRRYDPSSPEWSDRPFNPVINGWWDQARFFVDCVKEGREPGFPASNLDDAVKTMELIDLIGSRFDGVVEGAAARR
jgi:predicted dehydrogenase